MPAADLHASTGSVHIIKARGRSQWLHLCPSPHRLHRAPHADLSQLSFRTAFPAKREMGADEIYACIWDEIHFGKSTCLLWQRGKKTFLLPSPFSPPLYLAPFPEWESVMDVHVHNVSKNTRFTPALTPSVLHFSMISLLVLSVTYNVQLSSYAFLFVTSMATCYWDGMSLAYSRANETANGFDFYRQKWSPLTGFFVLDQFIWGAEHRNLYILRPAVSAYTLSIRSQVSPC